MTIKKLSSKLTMIMYAVLALFICLGSFAIISNTNAINSQAAVSNVDITFEKCPDTVTPFCIIKFYPSENNNNWYSSVLTFTNFQINSTTQVRESIINDAFSLSGTGKLEITVPMYCSITEGLPSDAIHNGSTYYVDVDSETSISAIKITYDDQGYFGGTVII